MQFALSALRFGFFVYKHNNKYKKKRTQRTSTSSSRGEPARTVLRRPTRDNASWQIARYHIYYYIIQRLWSWEIHVVINKTVCILKCLSCLFIYLFLINVYMLVYRSLKSFPSFSDPVQGFGHICICSEKFP